MKHARCGVSMGWLVYYRCGVSMGVLGGKSWDDIFSIRLRCTTTTSTCSRMSDVGSLTLNIQIGNYD